MHFPRRLISVIGVAACLAIVAAAPAGQTLSNEKSPLIPQDATALEGIPAVRLDATREGAKRRQLDRAEASTQSLKIEIVNGQYYWSSRENQPLTLSTSEGFTYLSSTEPGKYVRLMRINDRIAYVEHVDMAFGSVTYWGELRIMLSK
jgi:hypothetical protein